MITTESSINSSNHNTVEHNNNNTNRKIVHQINAFITIPEQNRE